MATKSIRCMQLFPGFKRYNELDSDSKIILRNFTFCLDIWVQSCATVLLIRNRVFSVNGLQLRVVQCMGIVQRLALAVLVAHADSVGHLQFTGQTNIVYHIERHLFGCPDCTEAHQPNVRSEFDISVDHNLNLLILAPFKGNIDLILLVSSHANWYTTVLHSFSHISMDGKNNCQVLLGNIWMDQPALDRLPKTI